MRPAAQTATGTVKIGAAAHSVRAVPAASLATDGRPSVGDQTLHVHLSEQPAENAAAEGFYGCPPTELLNRERILGEHTTAVHATHLSEGDIALLGGARVTAASARQPNAILPTASDRPGDYATQAARSVWGPTRTR